MSHTYHKDAEGFYMVRDESGHLICRDITEEQTARLHAAAPRMRELLAALGECKNADEAHDLIVNLVARFLDEIEEKEATT